ncbi:hypothetical protein FMEAI12_4760006 [Parafrankia sp. Ea1.12]|nr:hypothetical protein FMEAI12_4760006 [Parafrankia sp. Ea1.12]
MLSQPPDDRHQPLAGQSPDCSRKCYGLRDICQGRLHLVRQRSGARKFVEPRSEPHILVKRLAWMILTPVTLKCDVECRHGPPDFGDGKPKCEYQRFEVASHRPRQVDTDWDYLAHFLRQGRPITSLGVARGQMFGQAAR